MNSADKTRIILVFILGISLRFLYGFTIDEYVNPDSYHYLFIAQGIESGSGFSMDMKTPTALRAPLYPLFLAGLIHAFHNTRPAFRTPAYAHYIFRIIAVAQSALEGLSCVLIYLIGIRLFKTRAALVAAALYACYLPMIRYAHLIMSEALFIFLFLAAMLLLIIAMEKNKYPFFIFSGICLGLCTLIRGTAIAFPFFSFIFVAFYKKQYVVKWVVMTACMLAVIAPWSVRNYFVFHKFIPVCTIGQGEALWNTGNEVLHGLTYVEARNKEAQMREPYSRSDNLIEYTRGLAREGLGMIGQRPLRYAALVLERFPQFWWSSHYSQFVISRPIWPPPALSEDLAAGRHKKAAARLGLFVLQKGLLLLAIAGIVISIKRGYPVSIPILILVYFTGHIAFDPNPRYHLPAMPFVIMFSALALTALYDRFAQRS